MDEKAGPTDFGASQKPILCVSNTFCINPLYIDIGFQSWHKLYYCKFSVVKNINTKSNGHFKLSTCKGEPGGSFIILAKIQFNSVVFPK
jgi:hypothetical protein